MENFGDDGVFGQNVFHYICLVFRSDHSGIDGLGCGYCFDVVRRG